MPDERLIDLNADLGEGYGMWRLTDDDALLDIITSANVACGFHAGDPLTMRRVCARAAERGVAIGAQVGYADIRGFGRRYINVEHDELAADVLYQIGALAAAATAAGATLRYVKPHGALYNTAADDPVQADAVAEAIAAYDPSLPFLGLPDSKMAEAAAQHGLTYIPEGFADRAYVQPGRLMSRSLPGSVRTDTAAVTEQAVLLAGGHVDTAGAVEHARAVRSALLEAGYQVAAFA
jgi:UPF0271 protein